MSKKLSKKRKPKSKPKLIDECATLLQKLVRLKAADHQGYCTCCTCGVRKHWKHMQGAHYIERGKSYTKLMEENIHPSCEYCNMIGDKYVREVKEAYSKFMRDLYGNDFVEHLFVLSRKEKKYSMPEVRDMLADLKQRVKDQEAQLESLMPTQEDGY